MLIPKLRFKREDGMEYPKWTISKIDDVVVKQAIPVHVEPKNQYQEIGIRSHGKGLFHKETVMGKTIGSKRVFEIVPDCLVVNIVFAWERAVAKTTEKEKGMIASHRFPMYKPKKDILDLDYIVRYLTTDNGKQLLELASPGGAGRNRTLGQKEFAQSKLPLPCIEEQKKIADFLSSVDEVIAQAEAEVVNLEQQKKAAMQKIFSQEVRFKYDDGTKFPEWKETTIGEYCDILDNMRKPITKKDREAGIYPYYGSTNIQDYVSGYIFDEPLVLLGEDAAPFMDFRNKPIAQLATGKYWVNNHAHCLRPHGNVVFFFYSIVHKDIREYINNPERAKLNQEDMIKIPILLPCDEEQNKIANFLSAFDEAIDFAKKELKKWKELKKGLLQQMFI